MNIYNKGLPELFVINHHVDNVTHMKKQRNGIKI